MLKVPSWNLQTYQGKNNLELLLNLINLTWILDFSFFRCSVDSSDNSGGSFHSKDKTAPSIQPKEISSTAGAQLSGIKLLEPHSSSSRAKSVRNVRPEHMFKWYGFNYLFILLLKKVMNIFNLTRYAIYFTRIYYWSFIRY